MKKTVCILLAGLLLWLSALPGKATVSCSAKAAVVIESASGTVLYEKNSHLILPEASTTKIMTALIVLERASLTQTITVSAAAASVEGSQLGLTAGDRLTVSDLLYALMMRSGNDAAVALAEGVAGSESKFVAWMNEKANELGLNDTHFENPHGLPAEGHGTTARDLAELTAEALENDAFRALVSTERARLEYKDLILSNSNKLLYTCDGVFGVKTGYTKKAGRCLVTAAERGGVRLICVTLNDPDDWNDHATLYDACFARVSRREILSQGEHVSEIPVLGGTGDAVVKNSLPITTVTVDGTPIETELTVKTIPMLFAPTEGGHTAGYLILSSRRGRTVCVSPLNTAYSIEQRKEERTFSGSFPLKLRKLFRALTSGIAS